MLLLLSDSMLLLLGESVLLRLGYTTIPCKKHDDIV